MRFRTYKDQCARPKLCGCMHISEHSIACTISTPFFAVQDEELRALKEELMTLRPSVETSQQQIAALTEQLQQARDTAALLRAQKGAFHSTLVLVSECIAVLVIRLRVSTPLHRYNFFRIINFSLFLFSSLTIFLSVEVSLHKEFVAVLSVQFLC